MVGKLRMYFNRNFEDLCILSYIVFFLKVFLKTFQGQLLALPG